MVTVIADVVLKFNTNTIAHILHSPSPILLIRHTVYARSIVYSRELYDEIDVPYRPYRLESYDFFVVLYEHIIHTGSGECMNKYHILLGIPVCPITQNSSSFGYEQLGHTASVVWVVKYHSKFYTYYSYIQV